VTRVRGSSRRKWPVGQGTRRGRRWRILPRRERLERGRRKPWVPTARGTGFELAPGGECLVVVEPCRGSRRTVVGQELRHGPGVG